MNAENAGAAGSAAVLFPGQGSQEPNMGKDAAEASKEAMDIWKQAEKASGHALREIYWDGDEDAMSRTLYLQPALTAVNLSLWSGAAGKLTPACAAGHSLGEYSALAAAGVLSVKDVLELTALRGRLMDEADPDGKGKMAAVLKLDQTAVQEIVDQVRNESDAVLLVANYNSPAQYVVSGEAAAVDAVDPLVKERKGRCVVLPVSGAFHSPLMKDAAKELAAYMKKLSWNKAAFPVQLNVTGTAAVEAQEIHKHMSVQMTSSVRWIESIQDQWNLGVRRWLEVGPKSVLTRLLKANLAGEEEEWTAESLGTWEAVTGL